MPQTPARDTRGLQSLLDATDRLRPRLQAQSKLITAAEIVALLVLILWIAAGFGYFWPMWVWFGLGFPLAMVEGIRWARARPRGRERQLALHGVIAGVLCAADVLIWAMSGGGYFWPVFPIILFGGSFVIHAIFRGPRQTQLSDRVDELTRTRRGALDVQAAELRRIERDLHDGAQARLVALSMQLGRAEERLEDQPETAALVRRAREEAGAAIKELRDLARGIAPPVLSDRGLVAAVQAIADRSPSTVNIVANVPDRPPPVVETAAYFVVAESLTNVDKHAAGANVRISLTQTETTLVIEVADDGPGGANSNGGGLTGLRQRVEALDGMLSVESENGQGTTIRAEIPCA